MTDIEGDREQGQDHGTEDIGVDLDPDQGQGQETDTIEDHLIAVTDAEAIVLELAHHPEDEEVENAPEVEVEVVIITDEEDNFKISACKKTENTRLIIYQAKFINKKPFPSSKNKL